MGTHASQHPGEPLAQPGAGAGDHDNPAVQTKPVQGPLRVFCWTAVRILRVGHAGILRGVPDDLSGGELYHPVGQPGSFVRVVGH